MPKLNEDIFLIAALRTLEQSGIDPTPCAERAYAENRFADEIVPLEKLQRDEPPRLDTDLGSLAKLPPVFRKNGSVHSGNSSGVTDGASSMIVERV